MLMNTEQERIVYIDTCIVSELVKEKRRGLWSKLGKFLSDHQLYLGIGEIQILELSDATRIHPSVAHLFTTLPVVYLKEFDSILYEERQAHPSYRTKSIIHPSNSIFQGSDAYNMWIKLLSDKNIQLKRQQSLRTSALMKDRINDLKVNFLPSPNGKYTVNQAKLFSDLKVISWQSPEHSQFLKQLKDISNINVDVFQTIQLYSLVLYYKYYLGRQNPKIFRFW